MPYPRDDPERLSRRQAEWLEAIREHYNRTGEPPSRLELASAMGCISEGAAAYALGVLERKGQVVRIYNHRGARRYLPAEMVGGGKRVMTTKQVTDLVGQVDDQTLALLLTEIEAEAIRRGVRAPSRQADHEE